jgi:hypothetical protein
MHVTLVRTAVPMLLVLMIGTLSFAGELPRVPASSAPSIEGTYKLSSRKLTDGTVLKPPDIMGLQTYTKSYRNFNILNKNAEGKYDSLSIVSTYTLTPTEYTETPLFSISVRGQEIRHDLSGQTQRAAVTIDAGRLQFHRPVWTCGRRSIKGRRA